MSSKTGKKKPEPKTPPKAPKQAPMRPSGRVPEPTVMARHGIVMVSRRGKGYSMGELSGAGLQRGMATMWGVSVDVRRRSVLDGNVESLKKWRSHSGQEPKAEGKLKKVEEELEKVEMQVKKEAVEVKKEVAKVEKELKKEAAKAEKAVKAKAKPKSKPKKKSAE